MNASLFFKKMNWVLGFSLLSILVLAACQAAPSANIPVTGNSAPTAVENKGMPAATAMKDSYASTSTEAELKVVMDPKLGNILVGNNGMTLYMYTKDTPDQSNCAGGCLKAWPPLLTQGSPKLGDGVDKTMLGTALLSDGSKIVTYNHMPLYYWAKDTKAGDTTGQGVGKVWYVVSPDGKVIGR